MTAIRAVIADDEKPARERLRRLLARDDRVELVGCCAGGAEALAVMRAATARGEPVHVLLLDVQMPAMDGFGHLSQLLEDAAGIEMPAVIFVTAHDEFALRAFESHAADYLLKPFSDERFQAALDHAIREVRTRGAAALFARMQDLMGRSQEPAVGKADRNLPRARRPLDKIVLKGAHRVRLLPVEQISWIEAEGMYVNIHTRDGGTHAHRGMLGTLEESLDPRRFVRIHRSAMVNIDLVTELRQDAHGDYIAVLRDGTEVRVGRRFRARLQARLGQSL
jgi:two-component system, LytTR family, response regulator